MTAAADLEAGWVGRVVEGRYRILRPLGDGGMGSVYEAEHLRLEKRVALKVIRPELVADDEVRERFEREARATASVEHPHVTTAMDFGKLPDGGAFLVTQLVRGISLRERMSGGAIGWREACAIGAQIADALAAIHARGFVHRDLTPDNVLLSKRDDGSPHVHVLDLGVVGLAQDAPGRRLTAEGHVVGTTGYMAPEQALGEAVDARADLYALGVLLWEMCAGRPMFEEAELTKVVAAQLTDPAPPVEAPRGAVPPQLAALVRALLERRRDDRPAAAGAVRDELRSLPALPSRRPPRARPRLALGAAAVAAGLAFVAIAAGLAVLALGGAPAEPAPAPVAAAPAPPTPAPPEPELTPEQRELVEQLRSARWRAHRRAAARALREAEAPAWVRAAAALELATTCADRREALARVAAAADPRAAPVVARYRQAPPTGCGRGGRSDCYGCIRAELDRTWEALHAP
jgi:serine/threonine-protein kinase